MKYFTLKIFSTAALISLFLESFATLDTSFTSNFSLTKNSSQFVIPNDSKTYLLEASLSNVYPGTSTQGSHIKYQWYDVTNSSYVGIKGKVSGNLNSSLFLYNELYLSKALASED